METDNPSLPTQFYLSHPTNNPGGMGSSGPMLYIDLPLQSDLTVSVYNIMGQKVSQIGRAHLYPGRYQIGWNGKGQNSNALGAGLYFINVVGKTKSGQPIRTTRKYTLLDGTLSGNSCLQPVGSGNWTPLNKTLSASDTLLIKSPGRFNYQTEIDFLTAGDNLDLGHIQLDRIVQMTQPYSAMKFGEDDSLLIPSVNWSNDDKTDYILMRDGSVVGFEKLSSGLYVMDGKGGRFQVLASEGDEYSDKRTGLIGGNEFDVSVAFNPSVPVVNLSKVENGGDIYLDLDVTGGNLPFTVKIDYDNDLKWDIEQIINERARRYKADLTEPNIYVPYALITDADGDKVKVYVDTPIGILPDLEQRVGVGIKIATPEDPVGDYLKGMQIYFVDQRLFESQTGIDYINGELKRLKDDGINILIYNPLWFVEEVDSDVNFPIYGEAWPLFNNNTIKLENLIKLVNMTHDNGMRVGIRYFMNMIEDYDGSERVNFKPANIEKYIRNQSIIQSFYAELAQKLGVELYCIGAEHPITMDINSKKILDAVREKFEGIITDSPMTGLNQLYRNKIVNYLDVISFTFNEICTNLHGSVPDITLDEINK